MWDEGKKQTFNSFVPRGAYLGGHSIAQRTASRGLRWTKVTGTMTPFKSHACEYPHSRGYHITIITNTRTLTVTIFIAIPGTFADSARVPRCTTDTSHSG